MVGRVAAGLLVLLPLGACFTKPDGPWAEQSMTDGGKPGGDGAVVPDGAVVGCQVRDDFNAAAGSCGPWASPTVTGSVSITHDTTELRFLSGTGGSAVCASTHTIDIANGVTVDINAAVPDPYGSTSFDVVDAVTTTRVGLRIEGKGDTSPAIVHLQTEMGSMAMVDYDPSAMRTWRLSSDVNTFVGAGATPLISTTDVVLEYSGGNGWTEVGRFNTGSTKFTAAAVRLSVFYSTSSSTVAAFDNLDGCK